MIQPNVIVILLAGLIPLITGFIWYSTKAFGNAWIKAAELNNDKKGAHMAVVFILTYILGLFLSFAVLPIVIHQFHMYSIVMGDPDLKDPNSELNTLLRGFYEKYGNNFRTFKHGSFHGTIAGITIVTPVIAINAMFEKKGFKYIAINAGYWIVTIALMGGVLCAYS